MSSVKHAEVLAERAAGRIADAAQDVVACLAQGRHAEATELLGEVIDRATKVRAQLAADDED
ncbi:hypothetical protein [Spirillospora sp. NBC_01491]|uniref:hypothetical protein n=1 Tax=Spirillospora sp. NBC_01491 TaxID=2976007 RepID=UPI002E329C9A|nr:hypothetical protein [Spirillospora sp. NBC_01491]